MLPGFAVSPNDRTLALEDGNGNVYLYDASTGKELRELPGQISFTGIAFSPDGKYLVEWGTAGGEFGTSGENIVVWNTAKGTKVVLPGHGGFVNCVAVNAAGTLVSGDDDGQLVLWNEARGIELGVFTNQSDSVQTLAFSPNGNTLAASGSTGTVFVWDLSAKTIVDEVQRSDHIVNDLAFSPDGRTLVAGYNDGAIVLTSSLGWLGSLNQIRSFVCSEVRGNLTRTQWSRYVPGEPYQKLCPDFP